MYKRNNKEEMIATNSNRKEENKSENLCSTYKDYRKRFYI